MPALGYMVGDLGAGARRAAGTSARTRRAAQQPDIADDPAVAETPEDEPQARRRRRVKAQQLGRGYEYMDLEPEPSVAASDRGAGPLGFSGTAAKDSAAGPAGLATLDRDSYGGDATTPMMPSTWEHDLD